MLTGEQSWCQGFSEPGSGSDLASLQTRATKDGDDFVINGSKIWTSGAHRANMMFMIARTDPDAPKHRGITYFILDMKTSGITIQPLVQMSGAAGFNQVFFDNVRVPAKNVIGEVNRGWYVATTTLDYERSGIGSAIGTTQRVEGIIDWAKDNVATGHSMLKRNPLVRLELVDRLVEANVALILSYRVAHMQNVGMIPNHEASMCKMFSTELNQRIARTTMKMIGLYGMAWDSNSEHSPSRGQWTRGLCWQRLVHHCRWHQRNSAQHRRPARSGLAARLTAPYRCNERPGLVPGLSVSVSHQPLDVRAVPVRHSHPPQVPPQHISTRQH